MFKQRLPLLRWLLATCLVAGGPLCASAQAPSVRSISIEGTEIAVSLGDEQRCAARPGGAVLRALRRTAHGGVDRQRRLDPDDRTATVWLHT